MIKAHLNLRELNMFNLLDVPKVLKAVSCAVLLFGLSFAVGLEQATPTVTLPKPDSDGWIQIFRGNNQSDFGVYTDSDVPSKSSQPFCAPFYIQSGDTLRTSGNPYAQLIFKQNFSHYIAEVQLRWPGALCNTGMLTKIQWNDPGQSSALPTSIECQGDPNQGIGQVWALGPGNARPWITFRGKSDQNGAKVDSTKSEMDFGGSGGQNCIVGFPGWAQPRPAALDNKGWVTMRVESHGKDTARHFVDGVKVMEYHSPRIAQSNDANSLVKYLTEGMLSVQSEGGEVWYRNWRIKLLPEDPLYASLYSSVNVHTIQPVQHKSETTTFGFNGTILSILSQGHNLSDVLGKELHVAQPKILLKQ